jgi:hypothetical protein
MKILNKSCNVFAPSQIVLLCYTESTQPTSGSHIMPDQFQVTKSNLPELIKFYQKAPKAFKRVSAAVLNSMAFSTRTETIKIMPKLMEIRSPNLLRKMMRVEQAKKTSEIHSQFSRMGSIAVKRHDAFGHIQEGSPTRLTTFTDEGRGGSFSGKAKPKAKAVPDRHTQTKDYTLKGSGEKRMEQYLIAIASDRTRRRKPYFLPRKYKGMKKGVYIFKGGRVGTFVAKDKKGNATRKYKRTLVGADIRKLSTPRTRLTPGRIDWRGKALRKAITPQRVQGWWIENYEHEMKKAIAKRLLK